MARRRGERDVAAVAVPDDDGLAPGEQADQISDLRVHVERTGVGRGASVAAPVVAQHAEPSIEPTAQPQHPRRAVHRPVHERDERRRRIAGFVAPDRVGACRRGRLVVDAPVVGVSVVDVRGPVGHVTVTMRSTSVLAPLGRSGAPASTSTTSPAWMCPPRTAVSTANHTSSSVDR